MKYMLMMNAPRGTGDWGIMKWPAEDLKAHIAFMKRFTKALADAGRAAFSEDIAQRFWTDLVEEYDSVVERVLTVTHQGRLLDETPALQRRLEHRNPWIDPLSHLQVELLRRVRAGREEARPALLATITGIAAGMRNTG